MGTGCAEDSFLGPDGLLTNRARRLHEEGLLGSFSRGLGRTSCTEERAQVETAWPTLQGQVRLQNLVQAGGVRDEGRLLRAPAGRREEPLWVILVPSGLGM